MKLTKFVTTIIILTPIISFATVNKCDGNTYEINQCLKAKMKNLDNQLDKLQNHNVVNFKKSRDKICNDVSSTYEGGSYQSVKYGNCIISLNKWYINQTKV